MGDSGRSKAEPRLAQSPGVSGKDGDTMCSPLRALSLGSPGLCVARALLPGGSEAGTQSASFGSHAHGGQCCERVVI